MSDLGRVLVLAGGLSYEREVSLASGRRVADALVAVGVDAEVADVDVTLLARLRDDPPAAVFLAVHGVTGEDGALRDVLDLLDVPYVGATGAAARLTFDKPTAKGIVAAAGVTTPPWISLPHTVFRDLGGPVLLDRIVAKLGLPLVVKPDRGGSAMGVTVVREAAQLPHAMVACFSYGDVALLEAYADGREVAVSVIDTGNGPIALPAVEIEPLSGVFDYSARYTAGATEYHTPARLSDGETAAVSDAAVTAHRALGLRDVSRTDLIVTANGEAVFLETNVAPGMTPTSLFPMAVAAADHDLGLLSRELLTVAVTRRA